MFAGLLTLGMAIASVMWCLATAAIWIDWVLETLWVLRDGNIGPWSGWWVRIGIVVIVTALLLAVLGVLFALVQLHPAHYSGDWP